MSNNSFSLNPFLKKRILRSSDGKFMPADEYIEKYVLPKIGDADTIMLKKGKQISVNQFINKYVITVCQRDYNGDFDRFYAACVVDNVNDFFRKNGIDIQKIAKMPESNIYNIYDYYSIISRYIIYNDPVLSKKSVADIVGIMSEPSDYDKSNVANNLSLYFSKNTDRVTSYSNRSDKMLEYTSSNIISGLYDSFNKEPMVVTELENKGALISENGLHRYHVLRTLYLNELRKVSNASEKKELRDKYTIPVKMETIDLFKTYSNFLLGLSGLPIHLTKARDKKMQQNGNSILHYDRKQYLFNDQQLIEFLRENINNLEDRKGIINKLCEYIPSFDKYINSYFPELVIKNTDKKTFKQ